MENILGVVLALRISLSDTPWIQNSEKVPSALLSNDYQ